MLNVIRVIQINTMMRSHPLDWSQPLEKENKCWQEYEEIGTPVTVIGNVRCNSHYGNQFGASSET